MEFTLFDKKHECVCCLEDIDENNFVLYKDKYENCWMSSPYCCECIKYMIQTHWDEYVKSVDDADCAASLRRALEKGPPINLRDPSLVCDNDNSEVYKFYYSGAEQSAKLQNSLIDDARKKWIYDHDVNQYMALGRDFRGD